MTECCGQPSSLDRIWDYSREKFRFAFFAPVTEPPRKCTKGLLEALLLPEAPDLPSITNDLVKGPLRPLYKVGFWFYEVMKRAFIPGKREKSRPIRRCMCQEHHN